MEKEKLWLKFIISGKAEDYIKYSDKKREEEKSKLAHEKEVFAGRKEYETAKAEHEAELAKKRATNESEIDKIRNA